METRGSCDLCGPPWGESMPVADSCQWLCNNLSPMLSPCHMLHLRPDENLPQLDIFRETIVAQNADLQAGVVDLFLPQVKLKCFVEDEIRYTKFY